MTGAGARIDKAQRATSPILLRLGRLAPLSDAEREALLQLSAHRERHRAGEELLAEGDSARRPRFVLSGWATCQRLLPDGRRQIFRFALPGDDLGVFRPGALPALYSVFAATAMETVDAEPVLSLLRGGQAPGLLRAVGAASRIEDSRMLDHLVRLGRQTAYERVAHFLLELHERLCAVEQCAPTRFPLPLTQEMLADTLGLSIVHVNRTLQQMRRDGLIELRGGVCTLLKRELMVELADYRPAGADRLGLV